MRRSTLPGFAAASAQEPEQGRDSILPEALKPTSVCLFRMFLGGESDLQRLISSRAPTLPVGSPQLGLHVLKFSMMLPVAYPSLLFEDAEPMFTDFDIHDPLPPPIKMAAFRCTSLDIL